ncbi:MAG: hypothetical protein HZB92_08335 [Euryarchaeota archaeon]|nr:hypothetical protein [Euryarchaeota archaeon]
MNPSLEEEKIRKVIDKLIAQFKERPDRWTVEREIHWEFFRLLFTEFRPEEIKNKFRWEVPVGKPGYAKGKTEAAVDLVWMSAPDKWMCVEIEANLSAGDQLGEELKKCVEKLTTIPPARKAKIASGYVVPLVHCRTPDKKAKGYNMNYRCLIEKNITDAKGLIGLADIEIVKDGIVFE